MVEIRVVENWKVIGMNTAAMPVMDSDLPSGKWTGAGSVCTTLHLKIRELPEAAVVVRKTSASVPWQDLHHASFIHWRH
jgi:hypothetical protein